MVPYDTVLISLFMQIFISNWFPTIPYGRPSRHVGKSQGMVNGHISNWAILEAKIACFRPETIVLPSIIARWRHRHSLTCAHSILDSTPTYSAETTRLPAVFTHVSWIAGTFTSGWPFAAVHSEVNAARCPESWGGMGCVCGGVCVGCVWGGGWGHHVGASFTKDLTINMSPLWFLAFWL